MPAQGCAGKVHRNMDVTLHLAGYKNDFSKFLVPFTALRQHLYSVKSTAIFKNSKIYATEWNSATLYI